MIFCRLKQRRLKMIKTMIMGIMKMILK